MPVRNPQEKSRIRRRRTAVAALVGGLLVGIFGTFCVLNLPFIKAVGIETTIVAIDDGAADGRAYAGMNVGDVVTVSLTQSQLWEIQHGYAEPWICADGFVVSAHAIAPMERACGDQPSIYLAVLPLSGPMVTLEVSVVQIDEGRSEQIWTGVSLGEVLTVTIPVTDLQSLLDDPYGKTVCTRDGLALNAVLQNRSGSSDCGLTVHVVLTPPL